MSASKRYSLYGVDVNGTVLGGVSQYDMPIAPEVTSDPTDGNPYATVQNMRTQRPTWSFTSRALAAWFGQVPVIGANISPSVVGYQYQHEQGGQRTSGATHRSLTAVRGMVIPQTLTIPTNGDAELTVQVVIAWDGTNDPIAIAENVAVPALTGDSERFGLGPVKIVNSDIEGVRQVDIDFGIQVAARRTDGDVWPTFVSVNQQVPMVRLRGIDPTWFSATIIPLIGKAGTHANTEIQVRGRQPGGVYYPLLDTQHIKITADGLANVEDIFNAQMPDDGETTVALPCRYDGTNAPLVVQTGVALGTP